MDRTQPENREPTPSPLARGFEAARANVVPGAVLIAVAAALVAGYYLSPAARAFFERIGAVKTEYGFAFSFIVTAVFGGAVPLLVARLGRANRADATALRHLPYLALYWGIDGCLVDVLYRVQAHVFGPELSVGRVVVKTLFDQFVYCPIWAVPVTVLVYQFKESGYSRSAMRARFRRGWYREHVLPVLVSNWGVWVPAVVAIYCLPAALQLPIRTVILCLWAVLLIFLTQAKRDEPAAE